MLILGEEVIESIYRKSSRQEAIKTKMIPHFWFESFNNPTANEN